MTTLTSLFNGKHAVEAVTLTLVPMLPALLLSPLGWGEATAPFLLATMAGLMATLFAGVRLGLIVLLVLAALGMLALPAAPSPVWAGLVMALATLLYGLTARRGLTTMVVTAQLGTLVSTVFTPPAAAPLRYGAPTITRCT
jgi:hypothetical protein